MRSHGILGLLPAILIGVALLGPLLPVAGAQAASVPRVGLVPASAEPPVVLGVDDSRAEVLVSEALVLLLSILECGVLVLGLEVIDLWRERRAERRGLRARGSGAPSRSTLLNA